MAFLLFLNGLAVLGPVRTAIVSTVEPFFTAVLAASFLRQPMTTSTFAGGGLIAAAVILLQIRGANGKVAPAEQPAQDRRPQTTDHSR
jgi:drug/metabolite transporter (DMT)-like permease